MVGVPESLVVGCIIMLLQMDDERLTAFETSFSAWPVNKLSEAVSIVPSRQSEPSTCKRRCACDKGPFQDMLHRHVTSNCRQQHKSFHGTSAPTRVFITRTTGA
ncbi:hypothetical protein KCV00_g405, partial [Aureobasidium melanogenum]